MALLYDVSDSDFDFTQNIRKKMANLILEEKGWHRDTEMGNMLLTCLNNMDKQNEFRYKQKAEKEENDSNRAIAERAVALQEHLARTGRNPFFQPRDNTGAPVVSNLPNIDVPEDVLVPYQKEGNTYEEFKTKMQGSE